MATRFGIAPIIGNGGIGNEYRSAFNAVAQTNVRSVIPTNNSGTPRYGFAFSNFGTANLAGCAQVTNSYLFPDYPLDGQIGGIGANALNDMKQSVEAYNLDGNGLHLSVDVSDLSISFRELLFSIYQQFDPLLSQASFDQVFSATPEVGIVPP